uniref:Retrovirus-related Pol polyprotein from transposon TNT 1-94-like beta-barrel domain-containing protein n=1 Tax=Peronospora matthiolae TaxID=2874970 RepID=A0AAV1UBU3_9STRA
MDASSLRISKFDGTNFHAWKFKMQMVLEERDLWEVVSGEIKAEQCETQLDQATYKRKSRKAMAVICLAMEDSQLPLVRSASGACDAWSRLEDHFEKKSLANKLFLRRRFFTTMMEEGDDVLEHINKLKTLAEQLEAVGGSTLESRSDTLSWELVTSRLLHEEMKRKEQGSKGDEASQGQAFITRDNQRKGRPVKKSWPCHNCGKIACLKTAATAIDHNVQTSLKKKTPGDYLFSIGETTSAKSSDIWLVDSGATQHMTCSKKFMRNYKGFDAVDVHLADDGIVKQSAVGTLSCR